MSSNTLSSEETDVNQKRPLKEDVFDFLHENIISGNYQPGEWIRQEDIAKQLDVSMTPVREALDLLVASGLAERVPYRGVRVHEIVVKDVVEAYGMRLYLEVAICQEAARHITPEQIQNLERTLDEMKKHETLNEISRSRQLSRDFHSAIAEATGNDLLIRLYSVVSNAFPDWLLYEALFRRPEILSESMADMHDEHVAIVNALKNGNGMSAAMRTVEHVMESGKWLEKYLNPPIPAELLREKEEQVLFLLQSQTS